MNQNISVSQKRNRKNFRKFIIFTLLIGLIIFLFYSFFSNGNKNIKENMITSSNTVPVKKSDTSVEVAVTGDIMCHSTNFKQAYDPNTKTYDFSSVFSQVKDYISSADISIGNLETTFAGESRGYSGYPTFNSPAALGNDLLDIGIDVISTANNHSLDKGYTGLVNTLDELDKIGLSHNGTYRSAEEQNTILYKDVNGIKFAFLSFSYGTNGIPVPSGKEYCINLIDKNLIKKQLQIAKQGNPDVICVNMHWGLEYKTKQNSEQEDLANFLFKNGADLIFGSHPHVLQPMEKREITLDDGTKKDGFVVYSLGNFMSGQIIPETRNSIVLKLKLTKNGETGKIKIDSYDYIPTYMLDTNTIGSNKYKILDIRKNISEYESGSKNISSDLYTKLKFSLKTIETLMGPKMDFSNTSNE